MLYFVQDISDIPYGAGPIKIGYTASDTAEERVRALQIGHPGELYVVAEIDGTREDEKAWHHFFRADQLRGEWFAPRRVLAVLGALEAIESHYWKHRARVLESKIVSQDARAISVAFESAA